MAGVYFPCRAALVTLARWRYARCAAGTFSALPPHVLSGNA